MAVEMTRRHALKTLAGLAAAVAASPAELLAAPEPPAFFAATLPASLKPNPYFPVQFGDTLVTEEDNETGLWLTKYFRGGFCYHVEFMSCVALGDGRFVLDIGASQQAGHTVIKDTNG